MKKVKCKVCECDIYAEYEALYPTTNTKYFSHLQQEGDDEVNISIYLTCDNGHTKKYFCKIDERKKK